MGRNLKRLALLPVVMVAAVAFVGPLQADPGNGGGRDLEPFRWTKVYDGDWPATPPATNTGWAGRAGLQAAELQNRLYVMGGRTPAPFSNPPFFDNPFASKLWNDVWESSDLGASWKKLPTPAAGPNMWSERAYFQAVTKGNAMYVLGGQNLQGGAVCQPPLFSCSDFYNDVWRSTDGANWERLDSSGPRWKARAGFSAIVFKGWIYVLGGGSGDDFAIGGSGRELFNDVWRSRDGRTWELVTKNARWPARAGAAVVEKNGFLYILGGEDGFTCSIPGNPCPPYFNDVWRSRDGASWEQVKENKVGDGWSARPGHQCQVLFDTIVCFGGFGLPATPPGPPFPPPAPEPAHPVDVWVSRDGASWEKLKTGPWNATASKDVKYDFDSLVVTGGPGGLPPSIYTFGGDREASFIAPNPTLVDDEVWRFSQPRKDRK